MNLLLMVSAPWQRKCYSGLVTSSFLEPVLGPSAASLVDRRSAFLSAQAQLCRRSWHTTARGMQRTLWHQRRHHEIRTFFDLLMCTRFSGSSPISGRAMKVSFAAPRGGSLCELEQLDWYPLGRCSVSPHVFCDIRRYSSSFSEEEAP